MRIPTEITKTLSGAVKTVLVNGDYTYTQVTIRGRNTGIVTTTARPLLDVNDEPSFHADDFEHVEAGAIDLALNPKKRTFTIENKRLSALRFADAGAGDYIVCIRSWGRVS